MNQGEMQPPESPAGVYERHMLPAMLASWVPALLDLVALKPGERVLDVACGTGVVARQAASQVGAGGHVVGLDLNGDMLVPCRGLVESTWAATTSRINCELPASSAVQRELALWAAEPDAKVRTDDDGRAVFISTTTASCLQHYRCLPDTVDPRGPKGK